MIHVGGRVPRSLYRGSRKIHWLTKGGRTIYVSPEAARTAGEAWLNANVTLRVTMTNDTDAYWFDLEVILPPDFQGNPTDGWTSGTITLGLFRTEDLQNWAAPGEGWSFVPGQETPETMANGWQKWFVRCTAVPVWWNQIMVDYDVSCDRYGKSITGITIARVPVNLAFPYTMPAQAGALQTALRAAGFPGALVTSTAGALVAEATWHTQAGRKKLYVTMSGSNVTNVTYLGSTVGSGYPYPMPGGKAALQSMLTAALTGGGANAAAVVMLYSDTWSIHLPDRSAVGDIRDFALTISPGDPFPAWDMFGSYLGLQPASGVSGGSGNVRTITGLSLSEAARAFARLGFINIPARA